MPITRVFYYKTFRVPSKGVTTPGSLQGAPKEAVAPYPESLFKYLSEFPVKGHLMLFNRAHV